MTTTEQEVLDTVKAVKAILERVDEAAASDPDEVVAFIKDERNHIAMRDEISAHEVEIALEQAAIEEESEYTPNESTIDVKKLLFGKPLHDLELFLEGDCVGLHHAAGGEGSKGAYIVARRMPCTKIPSLYVIKELTMNSPAEIFASYVAQELGLTSPKFRVLRLSEFELLRQHLLTAPTTSVGSCAALFEPSVLKSGVMLMEMMQGMTMVELEDEKIQACFASKTVLRELGKCLVLDVVLNNMDRIPLLWNNNGNPGNFMFASSGSPKLFVIDNLYARITYDAAAQSRLVKIRLLAKDVSNGTLEDYEKVIHDFFLSSSLGRVALSSEQLTEIFEGFREAARLMGRDHKTIFEKASRATRSSFEAYRQEEGGLVSEELLLECLDLSFCSDCAEALGDVLGQQAPSQS